MVLAIDIGNTTIAFTGLEVTGLKSITASAGQNNEDSGSQENMAGSSPGAVDFDIVFSEKIPTETGKDTSVFLKEAGRVLGRFGIRAPDSGQSPDSRELVDSLPEALRGCQQESSQFHSPEPGQQSRRAAVITAVAISSVVPACTPAAKILAEKICENLPVVINWKCSTGLSFEKIPVPDRVGADRVADAAWAAARYPLPVMTVDMGTATTINIVSADRKFLGGMIGAGVRTALHSLRTGTAQLPELLPGPVPPEKLIGTDTSGCMLSAAVVGTAAMIDGLALHVEEQIGSPLTLILTGGNASAVSEWIRHSYVLEPGLAAKGSALIALRETGVY